MNHPLKKHKQKCQKRLRTLFQGLDPSIVNFSSSDYLSLSSHPYVREQGISYSIKWGTGPLPTRALPAYEYSLKKTEDLLAKFLGHETCTFYESDPYLLSKLSQINDKPVIFAHSISKRTGTLTCFDELRKMKQDANSYLGVNDSLSFSALGNHGFGLAAHTEGIDLLLGSFNKSFGSYVSYIACSKHMKSHLFEKLPSLHKDQFIPPLFLGMIDASIQLIPSMQSERKKLINLKQLLYINFRKSFFQPIETKAPFVALEFQKNLEMKNTHLHLCDNSFIPGLFSSSLTFSPTLSLTEKDISNLFITFASVKELPFMEAL